MILTLTNAYNEFNTNVENLLGENGNSWSSNGVLQWLTRYWVNLFLKIRDGVIAEFKFCKTLVTISQQFHNLSDQKGIVYNGTLITFDNYLANIHFVAGDLVYTEVCYLIYIAIGICLFKLIFKMFEAVSYIFYRIKGIRLSEWINASIVHRLFKIFV